MKDVKLINNIATFGFSITVAFSVFFTDAESSEHQRTPNILNSSEIIAKNNDLYSEDFKTTLRSCDKGNEPACDKASFALYNFGDMPKVLAISRKMCDAGHGWYCTWIGDIYTDGIKGVHYNSQEGYRYYQRGCEAGEKRSCQRTKEFKVKNNGTIIYDMQSKINLLQKKCAKGMNNECIDLAIIYKDGIGVAVDLEKSLKYFKQGCQGIPTDRRCDGAYAIMEEMEKK